MEVFKAKVNYQSALKILENVAEHFRNLIEDKQNSKTMI